MTTTDLRDQIARILAGMAPGESWPTNEALGGGPTGTRDDEYRASMEEQADAVMTLVAPLIAREKADALREAAAATRSEASGEPCAGATFGSHADWLDERADQIEKGADRG